MHANYFLFMLPLSFQRMPLRSFCLQIGSTAGFEDGPFESARLRRPSSIFYDIKQKCLYIADCENHAIRRADLSSRMLDTVYPKQDKGQGLIQRWLRGLGFMQGPLRNGKIASTEHQITYPWHLSIVPGGHIIAATQGYDKMWTIDVDTGALSVEPDQEPATIFKKLMEYKSAELMDSSVDWTHVHETLVSKGFACEGLSNLVSQVAVLKREALLVDAGMHQVLRLDLSTGHLSTMLLSNLGLLGLPAWWSSDDDPQVASSLERLQQDRPQEAVITFEVQPGRCLVCIDVALPEGTVLAEPLTDDCIWRQGRGSLVELSTFDGELVTRKVTVAQQYLDDLYKLESTSEGEIEDLAEEMAVPQQSPSGLPFYSSVDVSLGTGEVVFDAVLHLKRASSAGSDSIPRPFHSEDSHLGQSKKVTLPSSQKLKDFPDGALIVKHLRFRVKCKVSADALRTRMLLVDVQL
ncbi:hypothetical protein KC19_1G117300 [Ceratodon purpureus]|uniref:Uncharacterized protein n=1 Tax=Ceratodon purpureus TaxID=3225 RepID=A0A8T0J7A0_CERPU|nr:hypothetical protein KC19_1G117300 [Ceratodon purpureus]